MRTCITMHTWPLPQHNRSAPSHKGFYACTTHFADYIFVWATDEDGCTPYSPNTHVFTHNTPTNSCTQTPLTYSLIDLRTPTHPPTTHKHLAQLCKQHTKGCTTRCDNTHLSPIPSSCVLQTASSSIQVALHCSDDLTSVEAFASHIFFKHACMKELCLQCCIHFLPDCLLFFIWYDTSMLKF